jgi:translation elongation factor EF-Tu-like GTPase
MTSEVVNVNVGIMGHIDSGKTSLGLRGRAIVTCCSSRP